MVNAAESMSGRYPALGPQVLASAGIPLVDVGREVLGGSRKATSCGCMTASVWRGDEHVAEGDRLDMDLVVATRRAGRGRGWPPGSRRSPSTPPSYLRREHALLLDDVGIPGLATGPARP